MVKGVGVDLVCVSEVQESLRMFGARYLLRVFTPGERSDCGRTAEALAVRFAAKEAAMKALGSPEGLPWTSVELRLHEGQGKLALTGPALEFSKRREIGRLAVSVSSGRELGMAVVVAEGR